MPLDVEFRDLPHSLRAEGTAAQPRLRGHAIVFNSLSQDLGGFREIIAPEAVDRSLQEAADIRALVDHDSGRVIGRTRAGTLTLRKDGRGLAVDISPDPAISYANDIIRAVQRGDVSGMSFGFRVISDDWNMRDGEAIREVTDLELREISVVCFPVYLATDVSVAQRSLNSFITAQRGRNVEWLKKLHRQRTA